MKKDKVYHLSIIGDFLADADQTFGVYSSRINALRAVQSYTRKNDIDELTEEYDFFITEFIVDEGLKT